MEKRRLGKTGFEVSVIGLGGIPIQRCNQEISDEIIEQALKSGINFIDTARLYSVSEEYLGNSINKVGREHFIVATKSAQVTYEGIKADFETSYAKLGIDVIDLYQFHNVSKIENYEKLLSEDGAYKYALELKEKGLIREIGITSHSKDILDIAVETDYFSTIQFPYNPVELQGEELFKRAKERDIGVIVMKPIGGGVITQGELSLRYILENENVTTAIPGMGSVDEVVRNAEIGNDFRDLSEEERAKLFEETGSLGNDFCRRCMYCAPCSVGIDIPMMFTLNNYLTKYGLEHWARPRYESMPNANDCIECGDCEPRCPYELKIIEKLKVVANNFDKA
ncbi:MAG: aldo/keto reductase [Tissierellia bacterium]|nr:aldo/keto reductase [Tissierellia bacterium]